MEIFLVNQENIHAESLMKKLSGVKMPGEFIKLSEGEIALYESPDFKAVHIGSDVNHKIVELNPDKKYVFILDPDIDNIDDTVQVIDRLGLDAGIIRTSLNEKVKIEGSPIYQQMGDSDLLMSKPVMGKKS